MQSVSAGCCAARSLSAVDHDAFTVAQAAAYSAMVAVFPAMVVIAALVALLPPWLPLKVQMADFFMRVLPRRLSPLLDWYFATTHQTSQTAGALLSSGVVSLLGAGNVMATLMEGFRRAHDLPLPRGSFWSRRGRALALVPLSLLPMTAASALVVFGHLFTHWLVVDDSSFAKPGVFVASVVVRWTVALGTSVGIIAVIYHLGTDLSQHVREQTGADGARAVGGAAARVDVESEPARGGHGDGAVVCVDAFVWVLCDAICELRTGVWIAGRGDCADGVAVHYCADGADWSGVQCAICAGARDGDAAAPLWKNRRPRVARVELID